MSPCLAPLELGAMSRRLATTVLMQVCAAITVAAGISGLCSSPPACLAVQSAGSGIGAEVAQVCTRSGGLPCPPFFIPLRGGGVAAAGAGAGEDSSSTGALEGAQEPVVPWDALLRDLKTEKPLDKAAEFEKARDALFHGNLSALESLRQDWQNRTFRGEKVSREEAQFWRLERYAQRWPPPWLSACHCSHQSGTAVRRTNRSDCVRCSGRFWECRGHTCHRQFREISLRVKIRRILKKISKSSPPQRRWVLLVFGPVSV